MRDPGHVTVWLLERCRPSREPVGRRNEGQTQPYQVNWRCEWENGKSQHCDHDEMLGARGRYRSRGRRVFVFYNRLLLPGPCDATHARQTTNATTTPAKAMDPPAGMSGKTTSARCRVQRWCSCRRGSWDAAQADLETEWPGLVLATLLSTLRGLESVHAHLCPTPTRARSRRES